MKFDYIIIGGGLSGLSAGIRLAESGKKTAIVSSGQSALHFCSGTLGLLGKQGNKPIASPLSAIAALHENHPYKLIGEETVAKLAAEVPALLKNAGITVTGSADKNHYSLTPFGTLRPSWLTLAGFPTLDNCEKPFDKALVVAIKGFLESYPSFMVENLEKIGVNCRIETIDLERLSKLRKSNFDMRAVSVAKQIDNAAIEELASKINSCAEPSETILVPAIIGFKSEEQISKLRELVSNPLFCVPTLPVSVAGLRTQNTLQRYFEKLGGTFLLGDHVEKGIIENGKVKSLVTTNFSEDHLEADAYIIATGSLFSEGIKSNPKGFFEPVFGLDVNFDQDRDNWYSIDFFATQPYMEYGLKVDKDFHPSLDGTPISNLYAVGAALGHCNSLKEDSGAGTAILTALHAANQILEK